MRETMEETAVKTKRVNPFKGVRYKKDITKNFLDLLAPPYDVISQNEQDALYNRDKNNIVRLILGKIKKNDTEKESRYTRSAATLEAWLADGTLVQDDTPALYLYAQDFDVDGKRKMRTGFICRRLVEPLGTSIHPHERTLSGPKTDRLNLTRACKTNFSQVFGLYADEERVIDAIWKKVMKNPADISVTDDAGEDHHLWVVTDVDIIEQVQQYLEDKPVVIADGHHRYETALNYKNERRKADGDPKEPQEYDYAMMFLANSEGEGFTVLATHRVVMSSATVEKESLIENLSDYFLVSAASMDEGEEGDFMAKVSAAGKKGPSFGLYMGQDEAWIITLTEKDDYLDSIKSSPEDDLLKLLDVSVLQNLIFENVMGVTREQVAAKKDVTFTIDPVEVKRRVDSGEAVCGFLMNPTDIGQVIEVATSGGVMPQKSTYFYPKLISGLVMNRLA